MKEIQVKVIETRYQCEVCLKVYADPDDATNCEETDLEKIKYEKEGNN